jgi:hypothetical protein
MKKLALVLVTSKESMIKCAMKKKYAPLASDWSRKTQETSRRARLRNAEAKLRNPLANESGVRFTERGPRDSRNNNDSKTKSKLAQARWHEAGYEW